MLVKQLLIVVGVIMGLQLGPATAQQGAVTEAAPLDVTLVNSGAFPVELLWVDEHGQPQILEIGIDPGRERSLAAWPGTTLLVQKSGAGETAGPFYEITLGAGAPSEPILIPDPRVFETAVVTVNNPLETGVALYLPPEDPEGDPLAFDTVPAGDAVAFEMTPGLLLLLQTEDDSLAASYLVGLEAEQLLDLGALADPDLPKAGVTVSNGSARPIVAEEVRPDVIQRLGRIEPATALKWDMVVDADLRVRAADGDQEQLGLYRITDAADQVVALEDEAEPELVIAPPAAVELSVLPEESRAGAAGFIQKIEEAFAGRDDIVPYIAYNRSQQPVWWAGLRGDELVGARQIKPGGIGGVIAQVGNFSIAWPATIEPKELKREDVFASVLVAQDMPKVVDVSPPPEVALDVANGVCKPVVLFRIDAFGDERPIARLEPLEDLAAPLKLPAGSLLVARAAPDSLLAGQKLWSGQLDGAATQRVAIEATSAAYDPMLTSTEPGPERTLRLHNSTSRGIDLFLVDETGREFPLTEAPIALNKSETFFVAEGTVIVFRRPDVPPAISEYARIRVGAKPTQAVDIGALRKSQGVAGNWIDLARPALAENNTVGTTFFSLVGQGGLQVAGSMNGGDAGIPGAARFEGCADEREAFGHWFPGPSPRWGCVDASRTDRAGVRQTSFGRFSAQRTATGTLVLRRGFCEADPQLASTWHALAPHYDDMDPSKEAFQTGYFNLAWAPPSFDWVGRGFDLLRTDPLDYGATERGITSDSPLFDFAFEDRAGSAIQTTTKSIFGVRYLAQGSRSDRCDRSEKLVRTLQELDDFASTSYGGSIGVPGIASFSLSRSVSEINKSSTGSERVFIMERCDARLHALTMDLRWSQGQDHLRQRLERGFRDAVSELPVEWGGGAAFRNLIKRFGTHFSERIVYGGTFFAETEVNKQTYQSARREGERLAVEAEGTLKKLSLGGNYSNEKGSGRSADSEVSGSTYRKWSVGGTGSDIYPAWAPTVAANPAPISVSFRPIYDLLTPVFFPDDPDIGIKNALLKAAVEAHFGPYAKDMTSDPRALDRRDPRSLCVQMEVVEYSDRRGDYRFYSYLHAGIMDASGEVIDGDSFALSFTDNLLDPVHKHLLPAQCAEPVTESYVYNGSIFVYGTVGQTKDNGTIGLWFTSKDFPDKGQAFSLRRLEPGVKQRFEGRIAVPETGVEARYKLSVWVNGT